MAEDRIEDPLLPGEVGLLTVAERRGLVRTPTEVDHRNDVAAVERQTLLEGLVERGLMKEVAPEGGERLFEMTADGRAALAAVDERH
jgi:hypothetical protein